MLTCQMQLSRKVQQRRRWKWRRLLWEQWRRLVWEQWRRLVWVQWRRLVRVQWRRLLWEQSQQLSLSRRLWQLVYQPSPYRASQPVLLPLRQPLRQRQLQCQSGAWTAAAAAWTATAAMRRGRRGARAAASACRLHPSALRSRCGGRPHGRWALMLGLRDGMVATGPPPP